MIATPAAAVRVALETLRAHPLRTGLSTLGVVMGAGSLAAVLSIGDGAERFARSRIEREGMQIVSVQPKAYDTVDGLRVPREHPPRFTLADVQLLNTTLAPQATVALVVEGTGLVAVPGAAVPRAARVVGTTDLTVAVMDLRLAHGRAFTHAEVEAGDAVAVVSQGLARAVAGPSAESGTPPAMRLGSTTWRIVGVTAPVDLGPEPLSAFVPHGLAEQAMVASPSPRLAELRVRATRVEDVGAVRDRVRAWIAGRDPAWIEATTVAATGTERLRQMEQGILVFKMLMGAITAISLLVGGIGIMNVLLASIADRTREIGLRKAMGASRRVILLQFLAEAVAIAGTGSLVGVAAGIGGAFGVTAIVRARTAAPIYAGLSWQTLAVSIGVALGVGLVFGLYPALRAARLSPIDALRYE